MGANPDQLALNKNRIEMSATLIEIRPHQNGWKVFEAPGVEPVFLKKDQAINYAQNRASFRSGEIRILDATGNVEWTIHFTEAEEKCRAAELYQVRLVQHSHRFTAEFLISYRGLRCTRPKR